jgi:hypothetical protein|tara:strand:- start:145 stop:291 length:147 start_codon:yes stop_codon:yes gene_type:complete
MLNPGGEMKERNRKLIEWGLIIAVLAVVIIVKYYISGCVVVCGDWYDD